MGVLTSAAGFLEGENTPTVSIELGATTIILMAIAILMVITVGSLITTSIQNALK